MTKWLLIASYFYGVLAISGGVGSGGPLVALTTMPVILFLAVLVHEVGHLAVGVLLGMTPTSITAYPLELRLRPLRLGWRIRRERRRLGGFVTFAPGESSTVDWLAIIAAGPAANVFLAIAAAVISMWVGWPSFLGGVAIALAGLSMTMAVANLIPCDNNDGANLVACWGRLRAGDQEINVI